MSKSVLRDKGLPWVRWLPGRDSAFRLVLWYVIAGALWLVVSDWLVAAWVNDKVRIEMLDGAGDLLFVAVTAGMLAWLQARYLRQMREAANQLQESETRLRLMGDNLPDSYVYQFTHTAGGQPHFVHLSAGVERVHGLPVAEVLRDAMGLLGQINPAQRQAYQAAEAESARSLTDFDMELPILRADGKKRLLYARSRPKRDGKGQVLWDGFVTDITGRRQLEVDQAAAAARYRSLFDNMRSGLAHCRMIFEAGKPVDFIYLDVNPAFGRLTGLEDVVGKTAGEVLPGIRLTDPELLARYGRVASTGMPQHFEIYVAALKNWLAISVYCPAKDHFVAVFDVVTERKQTAEALQRSEQNYREIFNATNEAIVLHDAATGKILDVNDAMWRMHGFASKEEFLAGELGQVFDNQSTYNLAEAHRRIRLAVEQGPQVFEWRNHRRNGESFWSEVSLRSSEIGGRGRVLAVVREITERKKTESALLEREQQLRLFVEHCPAGIAMLDRELRYLVVSHRWRLDYQLGDRDIIGRCHYDIFPEIPERWKEIHRRCLAGAIEKNEADTVLRADGSTDSVHWEIRPWQTADAQIGGLIIFSEVITERVKAGVALQQSEEQFRAMFETASVGMGQADPKTGTFLRVNQKLCEITGYPMAELLKLKVPDITHPSDRARDWQLFQQVIRREISDYHIEKRYLRKDGKEVWVNVHMTVIRDAAGEPLRTMATIEDITERRRAEEERMRLSTALEQTAESIVITDLTGMIVYVNPAFERITGYTRREAIGQNPRVLKSGQHDVNFYKQMWGTLARGEVWRGRLINHRKDGTVYEENATISPVRDGSGRIVNYMAIKLDMSREVELEGQFRQAQKLEAIGQLAGGVAHDFNNILTSILMQVGLANMSEQLHPDERECFRQIQKDAERAAALTRQLLLFSRRQVMQSQDLDLNEIVTNLAKMLQRIIGEDVRLQLHLHPSPLWAHADAGMLDQVAMNLAVNARDAMPGGGRLLIETSEITLDEEMARHQPGAAPGRYVCLGVTDTGCGIPPDVMPRIFEPFFTTKETGKGTGLGLATVFGIVQQHRGWLKVDSEAGRGTTFKVFLPAIASVVLKRQAEKRPAPRGGTETILLAEDEALVRHSIRTILTRHGYNVVEAANGEVAYQTWAEQGGGVSMLVTDLVMPGAFTGQQLAGKLRETKPGLKVVYMSGYSAENAGREIELQAGENFIQKPVNPEKLLETIRCCLDEGGPGNCSLRPVVGCPSSGKN